MMDAFHGRSARRRSALRAAVALLLTIEVAACGAEARDTPTHAPALTSTATAPPAEMPPPDRPGTPLPGEITAGDLADRIGAAWPAVRTYRATQTARPVYPIASPAPFVVSTIVDEVILPDTHRRVVLQDGVVTGEIIAAGGHIYLRGSILPGPATPASADAWQRLDPAAPATPSPFSQAIASLLEPVVAPYSRLSESERLRIARPVGSVVVNGRSCAAFAIADATMTGERVEVVIALDEDDLPCAIMTRAGSTEVETVYEFNVPLTIAAPM